MRTLGLLLVCLCAGCQYSYSGYIYRGPEIVVVNNTQNAEAHIYADGRLARLKNGAVLIIGPAQTVPIPVRAYGYTTVLVEAKLFNIETKEYLGHVIQEFYFYPDYGYGSYLSSYATRQQRLVINYVDRPITIPRPSP